VSPLLLFALAIPIHRAFVTVLGMGNSIDKVDEGLYICGVEALADFDRLDSLGIKCILNAASVDLYRGKFTEMQLRERYEVKALECQDSEDCNLSVHFDEVADFVEQGRRRGGVAVHCAAGVSRATTSMCAYMMIKEHYDLDSAFLRIRSVRNRVQPNSGFWRQLRDLEAVLRARGVQLQSREPPPQPQPAAKEDPQSAYRRSQDPRELIKRMDEYAQEYASFGTHYLTARIRCAEGVEAILRSEGVIPGVSMEQLERMGDEVQGRAKCVPSMDGATLQALIAAVDGVDAVEVEAAVVQPPP